jgi:DNA mismatch endonuclease (patch repair protein)
MADVFPKEQRSAIMRGVGRRNTAPEILVRQMLHKAGYRFRLERKGLPGKPDIVLPKYKAVVFVHGCFWHRHEGCPRAALPVTNHDFWENKLEGNKRRDKEVLEALSELGWSTLVVWQCETRDKNGLWEKLAHFLGA